MYFCNFREFQHPYHCTLHFFMPHFEGSNPLKNPCVYQGTKSSMYISRRENLRCPWLNRFCTGDESFRVISRFRSNHRFQNAGPLVSLSCPLYLLNFWSIVMQSLIVERPLCNTHDMKPSLVEQANSYKSTHEVNSHTHSTSQENNSKPQLLEKLPSVQRLQQHYLVKS